VSSLDRVKFTVASGGTGSFVVSAPVTGFLTPAGSGMANGQALSYVAFSADQTQWEYGHSTYTVSGTTIARSPINSSAGLTTTVNFTNPPTVAICLLSEDIPAAANPSAVVGLGAVNGSASTFMRSDAAPALSQAITPTWTGTHQFNATITGPNSGTWSSSGISVSSLNNGTGASSSTFWRGDGTWATPAGGGSGTVTSVSVTTANGVSGSVANPTTTPAISLTLGAITPASVNSTSGSIVLTAGGGGVSGLKSGGTYGSFATSGTVLELHDYFNSAVFAMYLNNSGTWLAVLNTTQVLGLSGANHLQSQGFECLSVGGAGAPALTVDTNLFNVTGFYGTSVGSNLIGVTYGDGVSGTGLIAMTMGKFGLSISVGQLNIPQYTVAGLAGVPGAVKGSIVYVSDQLTSPAAKGVAPTGGGSVLCAVYFNGSSWVGL
jgi:hypothetical protein